MLKVWLGILTIVSSHCMYRSANLLRYSVRQLNVSGRITIPAAEFFSQPAAYTRATPIINRSAIRAFSASAENEIPENSTANIIITVKNLEDFVAFLGEVEKNLLVRNNTMLADEINKIIKQILEGGLDSIDQGLLLQNLVRSGVLMEHQHTINCLNRKVIDLDKRLSSARGDGFLGFFIGLMIGE